MTEILNLTGRTVTIVNDAGTTLCKIAPHWPVKAKVAKSQVPIWTPGHIPDPVDGTVYLVDKKTAESSDRDDLVYPSDPAVGPPNRLFGIPGATIGYRRLDYPVREQGA